MLTQFINTFSFVLIPFVVISLFSLVLPSIGTFLYLRNEIMVSIALPSVASLFLIINTIIGISSPLPFLIGITFIETFLIFYFSEYFNLSKNKRDLFYATLFISGNFLTPLLLTIFPSLELEKTFLLKGELLSIDKKELVITIFFILPLLLLFWRFRNSIFSYCIDEEMIKLRTNYFKVFSFSYKITLILTITISTIFIGPVPTTTFLIIPPLFSDFKKNSLHSFIIIATLIGISGSVGGFFLAIIVDLPPAYSCSFSTLCSAIFLKSFLSLLYVYNK